MALRAPAWRLAWTGTDVAADLEPLVTGVEYADVEHGRADEIELRLVDADGRWRGAWYPAKGDRVELALGYRGERLLPCGTFELDAVEITGPPDAAVLRGLAAPVTPSLRTRRSDAFEDASLREIAEAVAARHGLRLTFAVEDVPLGRVTQNDQRDLEFLRALAARYGHVVAVRGDQLVFWALAELEAQPPALTLRRGELVRWAFTDGSTDVYRACECRYQHPREKRLITARVEDPSVPTGDTLTLSERLEHEAQAERRARAALAESNRGEVTGRVEVEGDTRLVAGVVADLVGFGRLDGRWFVNSSRHRISKSRGYTTRAELRRIERVRA